jgi:hypothetical protein
LQERSQPIDKLDEEIEKIRRLMLMSKNRYDAGESLQLSSVSTTNATMH